MKKILVLAVLVFGMIACSTSERENLSIVEQDGFYGVINQDGETVLPCIFENMAFDGPTSKYDLVIAASEGDNNHYLFSPKGDILLKGKAFTFEGGIWKNEKGECYPE